MKPNNLILRSGTQDRVSKDGNEHRLCCRPFETRAARAPQGEDLAGRDGRR